MSDRKRLYELSYVGGGPAYFEDAGELLKISGILMQGMGLNLLFLSPTADESIKERASLLAIFSPTLDEWSEILRRTDDPLIYEEDETGTVKAIHRKQEYAISGSIQQQIWARDGFQCLYCGGRMGEVVLTIDHFVPLEKGGANNETNYLSACRQCNKRKGKIDPVRYCEDEDLDYDGLVAYLAGKCSKLYIGHLVR